MIAIDQTIDTALKELGIRRYPCIMMEDGTIQVKEMTTKIGCVVETIVSSEQIPLTGLIRIESLFYFFSRLDEEKGILSDLNPKMLDIVFAIERFKQKLKSCPNNITYPRPKNPSLRYKTTAIECGQELIVTFDVALPC